MQKKLVLHVEYVTKLIQYQVKREKYCQKVDSQGGARIRDVQHYTGPEVTHMPIEPWALITSAYSSMKAI